MDDDNPSRVCVCFLWWSATSVLVPCKEWEEEGKRGDEGSLGKALQIRSNYSSLTPFAFCVILDVCCPLWQATPVLYSTMFSRCLVVYFFCSFVFWRRFLSAAFCALFSCFCQSTSANGVYIGSHDCLCSSFLSLPSFPLLYFFFFFFLQYHSPQ